MVRAPPHLTSAPIGSTNLSVAECAENGSSSIDSVDRTAEAAGHKNPVPASLNPEYSMSPHYSGYGPINPTKTSLGDEGGASPATCFPTINSPRKDVDLGSAVSATGRLGYTPLITSKPHIIDLTGDEPSKDDESTAASTLSPRRKRKKQSSSSQPSSSKSGKRTRTAQQSMWANVNIRVHGITVCVDGQDVEYSWDRWRGWFNDEYNWVGESDDGYSVISVKVRPNGTGYPVDASRQIGENAFEGYDWMNERYVRMDSDFVTRLISSPGESHYLGKARPVFRCSQ